MNGSKSQKLLLKASIPIVESYLSGSNFASSLSIFYRTNSPKFKDFKIGEEYSLSQSACHSEFIESIEALITLRLKEFSIRVDDCYEELVSAQLTEETAVKVNALLARYSDFIEFGLMMRDKFEELFNNNTNEDGDEFKRTEAGAANADTDADADADADDTASKSFVRVLWDLENVNIPSSLTGFQVCEAITTFLSAKGLISPTTDSLMSIFRSPNKKTICKSDERDLDRAAVEQIICSDKREDADRKIVNRIGRDMNVLPPDRSHFVIISSDNDFTACYQQLKNNGFKVSVIHNARDARSAGILGMHCINCWSWTEVLSATGTKASIVVHPIVISGVRECPGGVGVGYHKGRKSKNGTYADVARKKKALPLQPSGGAVIDAGSPVYQGVCKNWNRGRGFGFIRSEALKGDVFVHNTSLPPGAQFRFLAKQEEVEFHLKTTPKGEQAVEVKGVGGKKLICEMTNRSSC